MKGKENARSLFVLSVVTFSVFLEIGIIKAFSVLLPDLKEQLKTKTWIVGSSIAIITGFGYLLGLSSGYLVNRFSPRDIVMASGFIASVGLIVCSIASSPFTLLIGLILTGFLLLQENVLVGVIPDYFDKHYATAVGIHTCGTGLGIVIFPILTQMLLDVYGWRGAVLLLGGVSFHSVPCGAVLASHKSVHRKINKGDTYEQLVSRSNDGVLGEKEEEELQVETKPVLQIVFQKLVHASGLTVFKRWTFITEVVIVAVANGYILTGWMIYTVSFAVSRGLSITQGSIIATMGGIGLVLIRILISVFHKVMTYKQLLYIGSVITAISLSVTAFCNSYITLNVVALLFGIGYGFLGTAIYIAAKENSEDFQYHFAVAWLHVVYGASAILGGVITGLADINGKENLRSWLVLSVVTFSVFLALGIIKAFSVLLPDLKEQLETNTWIVGSSIAIITGFGSLLGLTSGYLVNRFSPRAIVMASGLISTVGLIVCSIASSPLTLLIGLILTGCVVLQENVLMGVIPDYFDKNYATAVGIYLCGTGLGIVIFPVVTQMLLDVYGWRGALLLLSGVSFHSVPCGAVLAFRDVVDGTSYKHTYQPLVNHFYDKDGEEEESKYRLQILLHKLVKAFGLNLFKKRSFIFEVVVLAFANGYVLAGWMIYTVSFAVSRGLSIKQGSMVATTGGIGLICVRMSIPLLHKVWNYKQLIYTSSLVTALSLSLTAFCESYIALNVVSLLFGAGIGILGAEVYIAAKANSEEFEYQFAVAWLHVAYGTSAILSGVFTGLVYDTTGSFTVSFNLLAVMSLSIPLSLGLGHLLGKNEDEE